MTTPSRLTSAVCRLPSSCISIVQFDGARGTGLNAALALSRFHPET